MISKKIIRIKENEDLIYTTTSSPKSLFTREGEVFFFFFFVCRAILVGLRRDNWGKR